MFEDDNEEERYAWFRCFIRSAPGMWASYSGHVDVCAPESETEHEKFARAVRKLAQTSFPDRPSMDSWILENIEPRPAGAA